MHILFLTDNFPPEGNAPASRTIEHASRWVLAGHKVTVITGVPNFPEGRVFDGYKNRWYQTEQLMGVNVIRVKTYITANEGFALRIIDYLSFMVSSFFAGLFVKKPDVVVATSPQFFTAVSGWALSTVRLKPFVFELRDIWPASIMAVGVMKKSLLIRALEVIELFLYHRATRIISVTEAFKCELQYRGIDGQKIDVVLNGVDTLKYSPQLEKDHEFAKRYGLNNKFVAGYVGTHGMAHGLEYIVQAAEALRDRDDIRIIFAGGGAARKDVERLVKQKALDNVVLIPRVPKEQMLKLWSLCDVSIVNLRNTELFKSVIPSKIFESMGMGIPMIVSMPSGEATEIIRETCSGVVVEPEASVEIAASIRLLCDDSALLNCLAKNSLKASIKYSRDHLANAALDSLEIASFKKEENK